MSILKDFFCPLGSGIYSLSGCIPITNSSNKVLVPKPKTSPNVKLITLILAHPLSPCPYSLHQLDILIHHPTHGSTIASFGISGYRQRSITSNLWTCMMLNCGADGICQRIPRPKDDIVYKMDSISKPGRPS